MNGAKRNDFIAWKRARGWLRSLTGQWILLMLLSLMVSQLVFYFIYRAEQARTVLELRRDEVLARAMSAANLVGMVEEGMHPEILKATNTGVVRFWLESQAAPQQNVVAWQQRAQRELMASPRPPRLVELGVEPNAKWKEMDWEPDQHRVKPWLLTLKSWNGFGLSIPVRESLWLHGVYAKPASIAKPPPSYYVSIVMVALLLTLASVFLTRRMGRPLIKLTSAAERLGRGEAVEMIPEDGAEDIRRTAAAFNRMQTRLRRFVEDRTRMIAAISHDLRTPITSMRLRAEFLEDEETRKKFIASLDEMQAMTESTLVFAREEASAEPTRVVDLNALLESLCFDLTDLDWDVQYHGTDRLAWRCRPNALRRALRNVIENAIRYGKSARVTLRPVEDGVNIEIRDEGPGIAKEDRERVFDPFVRLEHSRNRDTGGVGLGLPIARSIVRSHGGDITLEDASNSNGLLVILHLPGDPTSGHPLT